MPFDDDFDLDEILGDSNGHAYQKVEKRSGPPLDYVADKARCSIEQLHELLKSINQYVPDDLPQPTGAKGTLFSTKQDGLVAPAWVAFRYALVSYLALNNMLNIANDHDLLGRLVGMTTQEFRKWLSRVDSEGSVTG